MKNILSLGLCLILLILCKNSNAQFGFSAGIELGAPLEEGFGLGYGTSWGAEYGLDESSGITARLGAIIVSGEVEGSSLTILPIQLGYRYYLNAKNAGPYFQGQFGYHFVGTTVAGRSEANSNLSIAVGGGYTIKERYEIELHYDYLTGDSGFSFIGIRAAYRLNKAN